MADQRSDKHTERIKWNRIGKSSWRTRTFEGEAVMVSKLIWKYVVENIANLMKENTLKAKQNTKSDSR